MAHDATRHPQRTRHHYDLIWLHTHRDYKGVIDGRRSILVFRDGTTSVPLEDVTDIEFLDALSRARRCAERPR